MARPYLDPEPGLVPTLAQGTEKKADRRRGQLGPVPGCSSGPESRSPRSLGPRPPQWSHPGPGPPGLPGGGETAEGYLASCVLERACRGLAPAELPYPLTWCQPCSLLLCLVTWVTPDHADSESPRGWVSAALRSVGAGRVARSLGLLC